eukprot:scaffold76750_cov75-Phaeocystis_antarctica.AAC.1
MAAARGGGRVATRGLRCVRRRRRRRARMSAASRREGARARGCEGARVRGCEGAPLWGAQSPHAYRLSLHRRLRAQLRGRRRRRDAHAHTAKPHLRDRNGHVSRQRDGRLADEPAHLRGQALRAGSKGVG